MAHARWTESETQCARDLIAADAAEHEFQRALGRTRDAAYARVKYADDPEYRKRCIAGAKRSNKAYYKPREKPSLVPLPTLYATAPVVIPPSVIDEAQKRLAAPKSLTGWICGDPPMGFSALDRREARA